VRQQARDVCYHDACYHQRGADTSVDVREGMTQQPPPRYVWLDVDAGTSVDLPSSTIRTGRRTGIDVVSSLQVWMTRRPSCCVLRHRAWKSWAFHVWLATWYAFIIPLKLLRVTASTLTLTHPTRNRKRHASEGCRDARLSLSGTLTPATRGHCTCTCCAERLRASRSWPPHVADDEMFLFFRPDRRFNRCW
jgi:hypothetical protein